MKAAGDPSERGAGGGGVACWDLRAIADRMRAFEQRMTAPFDRVSGICGFDGFIDTLVSLERPDEMAEFGSAVVGAAGIAASYPALHRGEKFGGNGPLFASALHDLFDASVDIDYIGALGCDGVLPIFQEALGGRLRRLLSVAAPARSECLEFRDGKIMLSDMRACADVSWERMLSCVGTQRLDAMLSSSRFIAAVNWGKLVHVGEIWANLVLRLEALGVARKSVLFFMDLAEFEHRPRRDCLELVSLIGRITSQCETILSLNLKEAWQLAEVMEHDFRGRRGPGQVAELAAGLKRLIDVDRVIVHPNDGAACASASGVVHIPGPVCREPLISIGAGDNFGAGCLAAALRGGNDFEVLLSGVCASGHYVRSGRSASGLDLVAVARRWADGELPERI